MRQAFYGVLVLGFVVAFASRTEAQEPKRMTAGQLIRSPRVLVIAHRGDSKKSPENTLPAFHAAVAIGADLVELDYRHSSDGVPFVFHDEKLDRTTDAVVRFGEREIPLASKSAAELSTLDAGIWFAPQFAGTRVPTLEEAITAIQDGSTTLIEHKSGDAETCVALLRRMGVLDFVVVQSFDWEFLRACRERAPRLALVALGEDLLTPARLEEIVRMGAAGAGWNNKHLTQAMIETLHTRGLKAWVWTVDDAPRVEQLVEFGIDGIITNEPAKVRRLMGDR